MQKYRGKILENKHITEVVKYCKIEHLQPNTMSFVAGQYFTILLPNNILRAYSIATDEIEKGYIETYVDITPGGPGSIFFEKAQPGDEFDYVGPSGRFFFENNDRPDVFISTGTGIVPFISMIQKGLRESTHPIYVLQGTRYKKDLFLQDRLEQFKQSSDKFSYDITLSREEQPGYLTGRVTAHLDKIIEKFGPNIDVYVCGGKEMISDVENILVSSGVVKENIKYEKYY